jgi:formaldehyde-activating enzyme involved in methanogenesis
MFLLKKNIVQGCSHIPSNPSQINNVYLYFYDSVFLMRAATNKYCSKKNKKQNKTTKKSPFQEGRPK